MKEKLPPGYSFLQSLWRTYKQISNPVGAMEESMQKYGGTYAVNLGLQRLIATQDPGLIDHVLKVNHKNYYKSVILTEKLGRFLGHGLLTSNGEYWLKQRRLIQPGFHADKIHALYSIMDRTVKEFLDQLPTGEGVDIYPHMNRFAFELVINTLFNVKITMATRSDLNTFITETQNFVVKDIRQPHKSWWFTVSGERKENLQRSEGARQIIRGIIHQRKESPQKFNDLLEMLLDARYEDNGEPMTDDQIIDEILVLLIAGHETTANALSWCLYLLAAHRDELQKLREETRSLAVTEIVKNERLNAVVNEAMRLYPPAWIADRVALRDDTYNNFLIPKDTIVVLFYYGLHRSRQFWTDPVTFKPERFMKNHLEKDKPKAYFPFGGGPRLCIGNNFAMSEMTLFLQAMVQRFDIKPTGIEPVITPLVTLRPDKVVLALESLK
jgi:cytochrome P450